jgi:phytoene synthase
VASAVGLASIEIFGYEDPATRAYAVELGLALQLTNILRDVGADAARGRLYLPLEDLARFGVPEDALLAAALDPGRARPGGLDALMAFEADRARAHYAAAAAALPRADRRGHPVGGARTTLGKPRRIWLALRTIPRVYWGS